MEPLVSRTRPDLVLLDLGLPGLDGLSCLALLRERHPEAIVVVLSGLDDDETVEKVLLGGATAFISKSITPTDLPVLLRQALLGNVHFAARGSPVTWWPRPRVRAGSTRPAARPG